MTSEQTPALRFRKKPIEVEAIHWTGENIDEVRAWIDFSALPDDGYVGGPGIGYTPPLGTLDIPTPEGTMTAQPGDWIIQGIKGEYYPVKPDIFDACYESAAADRAAPPASDAVQVHVERDDGPDDTYLIRRESAGAAPPAPPPDETEKTEQPFKMPDRIAIDANGYGWRVWNDSEHWSMVPTNPDNSPIPEPVTWFVPESFGSRYWQRVATDALERVYEYEKPWLCTDAESIDEIHDSDNVILMGELIYKLARERDEAKSKIAAFTRDTAAAAAAPPAIPPRPSAIPGDFATLVQRFDAMMYERDRLAEALRAAEWVEVFSDHVMGDFICGGCGNDRNHGHDDGCPVGEVIRDYDARGKQ